MLNLNEPRRLPPYEYQAGSWTLPVAADLPPGAMERMAAHVINAITIDRKAEPERFGTVRTFAEFYDDDAVAFEYIVDAWLDAGLEPEPSVEFDTAWDAIAKVVDLWLARQPVMTP